MKRIQANASVTGIIAALALAGSAFGASQGQATKEAPAQGRSQSEYSQPQYKAPEAVREHEGKLKRGEQAFLQGAARANAAVGQLANMAEKKSENPKIREIAQVLIRDNGQARQQLKTLAESKGVNLSFEPTQAQKSTIAEIGSKSGEEFNRAFLKENIRTHIRAIAAFDIASAESSDPDVQQWAQGRIATLKGHLAAVRAQVPQAVGERRRMLQKERQQKLQQQKESGKSGSY